MLNLRRSHAVKIGAATATAGAIGAMAVGAVAIGCLAIGALSVGALAVRRLAVLKCHLGAMHIRELRVDQLTVGELTVNRTLPWARNLPDNAWALERSCTLENIGSTAAEPGHSHPRAYPIQTPIGA